MPIRFELPILAVAGPRGEHLRLGAGQVVSFADQIAAVDTDPSEADVAYTSAVERILADARRATAGRSPTIIALSGDQPRVGTSSTALALAYRSAMQGKRTLLIDAATASAELSLVFASEHVTVRAEEIERREHLAALVVRDARSGLAFLPLAATEPDRLAVDRAGLLVDHVRALFAAYDLVAIDAGYGMSDAITHALVVAASRLLIVTRSGADGSDHLANTVRELGSARSKTRIVATFAPRAERRSLRSATTSQAAAAIG